MLVAVVNELEFEEELLCRLCKFVLTTEVLKEEEEEDDCNEWLTTMSLLGLK